jgi:hypothetical protein
MDTEIVKTLVFAVAFSTLVVIAYHFIMKHLREREMMRVLAESLLKNNSPLQDHTQKFRNEYVVGKDGELVQLTDVNRRRRYTDDEDSMILESPFRDHVIAEKLGRTVPAIQVRRHTLKKNKSL